MINIGGDISEVYVGSTPIEKAYIGSQLVWEKSSPEMVEIEYLQGTGTQYIQTGIVPNSSTGIHTFVICSNNTDSYFVGLRDTSGNTRWCIGHLSTGFYYGYGSVQSSNRLSGTSAELWLNYMNDKKFISSNNSSTKTANLPTLPFTPSNNIRLFGSAGVSGSYTKWSGKMYYAQISQGSDLIMDLIPVRIGQTGYMYDKISGNLFGNSGTGDFTLGNDISSLYDSEIEYIEGTGTQWINTGVLSYVGDSISIRLSTTSFGASFLCGARTNSSSMTGSFFIYGAVDDILYFAANNTYVSSNANVQDGEIHVIEHKQDGGYIDGVKRASLSMSDAPSTRPYALFTLNDRNTPTSISSCKLYGFTYKRGNITVMDLIPVRVGQVGYMYDKITKQLFGNAGTGCFVLGPDVT